MDKQDPDSTNQEETEIVQQGKEEERQRSMVMVQVLQEKDYKADEESQIRLCEQHHRISAFREADTKPFLEIHPLQVKWKHWSCTAEIPGEIVCWWPI